MSSPALARYADHLTWAGTTWVRSPCRLRRHTDTTTGEDLVPATLERWHGLRHTLETRRQHRTQGRRFRRNPEAYLADLENNRKKALLPESMQGKEGLGEERPQTLGPKNIHHGGDRSTVEAEES